VRFEEAKDIDPIAAIAVRSFAEDFTYPDQTKADPQLATQWVKRRTDLGDFGHYFVLEVDGRIAGYAFYLLIGGLSGVAQLEQIAIDPQYRGRGLGVRLVQESEELLRGYVLNRFGIKINKLFLTTSTRNTIAQRVYRMAGYTKTTIIPKFFWGVDEEVWIKER
jgi:ribosomal protein S18 acetylase RimI-like enzyme